MKSFLALPATAVPARITPVVRRSFRCRCGRPVFFPDLQCLGCEAPLGYDPERARLLALQQEEEGAPGGTAGLWRPVAGRSGRTPPGAPRYRRCGNAGTAARCNWLIAADACATGASATGDPATDDSAADPAGAAPAMLCRCCRLNRIIPNLGEAPNPLWWGRVELAKRRLVSSLIALGLPVRSRLGEDPQAGLAFDLLRTLPGMPRVITGHADGLITVNVEEADDVGREAARTSMGERYRTLLGHLRHEVGHYYWQRLVEGTPWHEPFRALFGDEREDYAQALQRHYEAGVQRDPPPPAKLAEAGYVSAYASAHPWEDWAETWAHYLHMIDTLDTAWSFGLDAKRLAMGGKPFTADVLLNDADAAFLRAVNTWIDLAGVLNELSRGLGHRDFYPFVLAPQAVTKLHFVHLLVASAREAARTHSPAGPGGARERGLPAGEEQEALPPAGPAQAGRALHLTGESA
jgi:hypothetical protein